MSGRADYAAQMMARADSHWQYDLLHLTTFDGMSVLMHGQPNHYYFVCYSATPADSGQHRCHLVTADEAEANAVFEQLEEALRNGLL